MTTSSEFPLLPLRDVVVYPHMVIPLFVGRDKSIQALDAAMSANKQVLLWPPGASKLLRAPPDGSPLANTSEAQQLPPAP